MKKLFSNYRLQIANCRLQITNSHFISKGVRGISVTLFFICTSAFAQQQSITITSVSGFPSCSNGNISITYTSFGFIPGTAFYAQLSDASGVFSFPPAGMLSGSSNLENGTLATTIPAATASGTSYRVRIIVPPTFFPATDNGTNLTINATCGGGGTPAASQWTTAGNDIYNNNIGNVGIGGAASATYKLNVTGVVNASEYYKKRKPF